MVNKIVPAFLLSTMLLLSPACEKAEIAERYYRDYEELGTSDEPGNWVPSFIPRSAVEIRAKYKVDTGAEVLIFNFGEFTEVHLSGYCNKTIVSDLELPPSGFLAAAWWPGALSRERLKHEDLLQYEFYRCERQAFLALGHIDGRNQAFYWRISLR